MNTTFVITAHACIPAAAAKIGDVIAALVGAVEIIGHGSAKVHHVAVQPANMVVWNICAKAAVAIID